MKHVTAFFRQLFAWLIVLPVIMIGCVLFIALGAAAVLLLPVFIWLIRRQIRKLRDEPVIVEPFIPPEVFLQMAAEQKAREAAQPQAPAPAEPYDYQAYYAWYYQQYGRYPEQAAHSEPDDTAQEISPEEDASHADESSAKSAG